MERDRHKWNPTRGCHIATDEIPVTASRSTTPVSKTRQRIKQIATDLLIRHGYNGMSFRDIALELDVTTTSIHYHFGNKRGLVDEVVGDYVIEALAGHRAIWLEPNLRLVDKLRQFVLRERERYEQFNKGERGDTWNLIGRLRVDHEMLSEKARASLEAFTIEAYELIHEAVQDALHRGEMRPGTPHHDLAFLLVSAVNSAPLMTQDTGGFDRVELFFDAFSGVMSSAYGVDAEKGSVSEDS